jgi:CheY-like chemotaxis protein
MRARNILLVDDDSALRAVMTRVLERAGHTVITAANGLDALGMWTAHGPSIDIVLTDLSMPGMSGWRLISLLRRRGLTVPILVVSADFHRQGPPPDRHPLMEFLVKPFDMDESVDRVVRLTKPVQSQTK